MRYKIRATDFFFSQIRKLDKRSKKIIKNKIELIKINPYRYKRIHSKKFSKIFRVRLNLKGKEIRLVYAIIKNLIILICLLERRREYKDLEKYLKKI
ncbi:MAG: hypothetical protein DRP00_01065 [Candidatus Aenigmatarchaeota archaeon]|nr:MAG: hypothetical protein DRP00_01065 [Candidatus Aenigmarchaeota archaeon]